LVKERNEAFVVNGFEMKKDSIVMLILACLTVGICIGHFATPSSPIIGDITIDPEVNLSFPKPVFLEIVKEIPAPPKVVVKEVIEKVYLTPQKLKNKAELQAFTEWLYEVIPPQPFGKYRCGLDTDLVQQLAFAKGFIVNVEKDGNYRHLILNAITKNGDYYTFYPPDYHIHKGGYLEGWNEYEPNYWQDILSKN